MATLGARGSRCTQTGLAVPECCCRSCLERMLSEYSPAVVAAEIRVIATARDDGPEQRKAA